MSHKGHSHAHGDHDHSHSHGHSHNYDHQEHEHSHGHGGHHDHDHDDHHGHSHGHGGHDHGGHDHGGHSHGHGHDCDDHDHGHGGHSHGGHEHGGHSHSHGHGHECDHDHGHGGHNYPPPLPYADPISEITARLSNAHIATSTSIAESNDKVGAVTATGEKIEYSAYSGEHQINDIMALIDKDLSEPYSIYTYRYFINNWPKLCIVATLEGVIIGTVVCKLDMRQRAGAARWRGYIAMLAVDNKYRKLGIGSRLVREALHKMVLENADEVALETEISNKGALALYENLGFVRDKRLHKYYLNGGDAFRLILPLTPQFLNRNP